MASLSQYFCQRPPRHGTSESFLPVRKGVNELLPILSYIFLPFIPFPFTSFQIFRLSSPQHNVYMYVLTNNPDSGTFVVLCSIV